MKKKNGGKYKLPVLHIKEKAVNKNSYKRPPSNSELFNGYSSRSECSFFSRSLG